LKVLDRVDPRLDPAEAVLLDLLIEPGWEPGEASVTPREHDILQEIMPHAFVCELEGFDDGASDALLLEPYVLRGEEDLGYLEPLLIEGDVLGVNA
jgi:hypothetical protein